LVWAGAGLPRSKRGLPAVSCLEGTGLSPAQEEALLDESSRVLVAAGAGSGKTRLLVAYFVRALVFEGIPAEQLIAVTFTRRAAAELVSRIRSSLEDCGRPDLSRSLDRATIGTIHGLCRRLIREHALEAGVDPVFTVLEAETAALLKDDISRRAWEQVVERADETELEVLASRREALRKQIVPLYDRLRGMGWERPQMDVSVAPEDERAQAGLAIAVREALAAGNAVDRPGSALLSDLVRLEECLAWLECPVAPADGAIDLGVTEGFFPSRKTRSVEPWFEPVRVALTRYRHRLAEARIRPAVSTMNRLLAEFHSQYETHKQERGLLDFADLELRARALVDLGRGGASLSVAPGSRILIDEFQDTNELQCGVLEGLGAARLLMVGDERQSIYRFRGADVTVFRDRQQRFESRATGEPAGSLHRLDVNYRSRPEILDFINRLFARETFFGARFAALKVPDVVRPSGVVPGRPGAAASPAVEVLVAPRRQEDDPDASAAVMQESEAEAVAARIRRSIDDEGRQKREIVVLLPAQTHVNLYQQAILARGVGVYVVRGKGYYSQEEVADVTSLLRLLVNPHDDLALVAALRSPLAGVSDDGLYLLGRQSRRERGSLWEALRGGLTGSLGYDDRRLLSAFTERLVELRGRVGRPGLARLIDEAISACDYDVCVLASPDGRRRFANVRKLMRIADEFEAVEGPDLAGFVDLLRSMGDLSDREGSAPTLAEGEDVVRVMTVHQAKGLEFPMVVLAGLGSDVLHVAPPEFVVGDDGRMGAFLKGSQRKSYELHDLCWGPAAEIAAGERTKQLEEDTRLLYVAMTRAMERLVLVGARPKGDSLEKCRIGRIVAGLGLDAMPEEGATVSIEGLDAVVEGVRPSLAGMAAGRGRQGGSTAAPDEGSDGACPVFLEAVSGGVGPSQVSFSGLAAYRRCARQFYLERLLRLSLSPVGASQATPHATPHATPYAKTQSVPEGFAEDDDGLSLPDELVLDHDEQQAGRDVGLLVHALLESLPLNDGPPAKGWLQGAALEWLQETGVHLSPADLDRAVALALAFWESPVAGERSRPTALREAPFFFAQGDIMVSGVMDLVSCAGDCWQVVDYKTNALNGRSPTDLAAGYELQAVTYCLAALRAGAPTVQMDFVFLERPETPVTVRYAREDVPRLESILEEALDGLKRARFPMSVGEACASCSVATVCASMARL
jgi:ATP-dependent helicase/nuclease subunit A